MIDKLLDRLNSLYKMSEPLSERVSELARITEHKAGTFILKEGQTCNDASLVVNGLVRSYYINEDKDITSRFMDEGFIVTSWISYYTRQPGNEFIETIEDTTLV